MENQNKAVFFDRDGTLNVDIKYLHRIEDFIWIEGAKEAVKFCNDRGYLVIVVTNQSGVARGYYEEESVLEIHSWMNEELKKIGAHINDIFYCPHHVEGIVEKYKKACNCRKPENGMLESAIKKYSIDREKSFFIGDADTDMQCSKKSGVSGIKYIGGNLFKLVSQNVV